MKGETEEDKEKEEEQKGGAENIKEEENCVLTDTNIPSPL